MTASPYRPEPSARDDGKAFRLRRIVNMVPIGLTFVALYMGHYNLGASGTRATSLIAGTGTTVYAFGLLFNGPLVDRIGGRRALLVGAVGACVINALMGLLVLASSSDAALAGVALLYAVNMYFQSLAALSAVKVGAAWFHVRERGRYGGVFGAALVGGSVLAYYLCRSLAAELGGALLYLLPAVAIAGTLVIDFLLVRDRPRDAGQPDFLTGDEALDEAPDASPGRPLARTAKAHFARVLGSKVMRLLLIAELAVAFVVAAFPFYLPTFLRRLGGEAGASSSTLVHVAVTVGGMAGALLCGWMSDRLFESRRAPAAFFFFVAQIVGVVLVGVASAKLAPFAIGFAAVWIYGVHSLIAETAAMDVGGQRGAATAGGLLGSVRHLTGGMTLLVFRTDAATWWPWILIPFCAVGAALMVPLWKARPGRAR